MWLSQHQTAGQNNSLLIANKSCENMAKFKYLIATVANQNCILEEIKSRLNSGSTCYHSQQIFFSSCLVSKNIILLVLYGFETWYLTLKEEHRLRLFKNRVLRRIFEPKRKEVVRDQRGLHNEELRNFYNSPNIIGVIKSKTMRWVGHVARMERGEMHTIFF
jgi:hypothetical protein